MKKVSMTGAERQKVASMPSANRKKYYQDMMMREANTNPTKTIADYKAERAAELKEQKRLGTREEQRAKKEASAKAAGFGSFREAYLAKQKERIAKRDAAKALQDTPMRPDEPRIGSGTSADPRPGKPSYDVSTITNPKPRDSGTGSGPRTTIDRGDSRPENVLPFRPAGFQDMSTMASAPMSSPPAPMKKGGKASVVKTASKGRKCDW